MEAFGIVLIAVAAIAAVASLISFLGSGRVYGEIGRGELSIDDAELRPAPKPGTAAYDAEAAAELRQLVEAKSARREARGGPPLDVEAELARLSAPAPAADDALRDEVRALAIASNERRVRRGEEPLDVESEVERQLRRLDP